MGKDRFHDVVKTALEKEGWQITDDPYELNVDGVDLRLVIYDVQQEVIEQWL